MSTWILISLGKSVKRRTGAYIFSKPYRANLIYSQSRIGNHGKFKTFKYGHLLLCFLIKHKKKQGQDYRFCDILFKNHIILKTVSLYTTNSLERVNLFDSTNKSKEVR